MVRTFSGQPSSLSRSRNNSSAYLVMRKNHCSSSRCSTGVSSWRQQHPFDDLLVGQHGGAFRTPVDFALLAISQAFLVELEKEPLIPAVVIGQAGGDFAGPVVGEAEALHLRLHFGDVAERPLARRSVVLDGGVFRGQAEGIPAHGMKHVVAVHPHVAGEGVANGVVAHVSHVQRARGIGQHFEHVVFLFCRCAGSAA